MFRVKLSQIIPWMFHVQLSQIIPWMFRVKLSQIIPWMSRVKLSQIIPWMFRVKLSPLSYKHFLAIYTAYSKLGNRRFKDISVSWFSQHLQI